MPILFLIVFIDLVGFGLVIPLLPFYAARFAASPLQMTTLFATYSLMSMLAAPLWGRLSESLTSDWAPSGDAGVTEVRLPFAS